MKTQSRLFPLLSSLLLFAVTAFGDEPAGFLFATYRGERAPQEEQVHFALSKDGREWTALGDGTPALVSNVGQQGARDPFLLRSHDGEKFYLLATNLAIHRNRDWKRAMRVGGHEIVVWESSDLVNWSAPRLATVAHELSGCIWAPEAIYDPERKAYLVVWASTVSTDGFAKHSIWASYTKDFVTFDHPFLFIEKSGSLSDPTIVRDGNAYYRFAKDAGENVTFMETAAKLNGPWNEVPGFSREMGTGYDSALCYPLSPAVGGAPAIWCLLLSGTRGYQPFFSGNLAGGSFRPLEGVRFPYRFRQGSVLPLNAGEYERLQAAYGPKPVAQ